jgi:glycosyltransferase involved in cell wall biosynthesis
MKKVLIITYYWPPSGGAGVQRWLKFVKYLRLFDWEPVVYTPENPESPELDESLYTDIPENLTILKTKIWEPYLLYKKFLGRSKDDKIKAAFLQEKKSNPVSEKISVWIRGNFFIPDARKFWIKPSVKFLTKYLQTHPVDLIISTGPPHSMHLIARKVSAIAQLPWIADFRDPWTRIDFYKDLQLTGWADLKHHRLEKLVLKDAAAVITVGKTMATDFSRILDREYHVITNGFDEDDIPPSGSFQADAKFAVSHIGSLVSSRNPLAFWKAIRSILNEKPDFGDDLEIRLVGRVDISVQESVEEYKLGKYIRKTEYLPHAEVIKVLQQSRLLLLLINNTPNANSILTGKFFEYLSSGRPIICIGPPHGDAASILMETQSGLISDFDDTGKMKENILFFYDRYKKGMPDNRPIGIEKYSRKNLTKNLVEIMNNLT